MGKSEDVKYDSTFNYTLPLPSVFVAHSDMIPRVINEGMLKILDIELGKDDFDKIIQLIGTARPNFIIDQHYHSNKQICYISKDPNDYTILLISGDVWGSYIQPDAYVLVDNRDWRYGPADTCFTSNKISISLRNKSGVGLGTSKTHVEELLGRPSHHINDVVGYKYRMEYYIKGNRYQANTKESYINNENLLVTKDTWFLAEYEDGRIIWMAVGILEVN
jgi:hypothetical protein